MNKTCGAGLDGFRYSWGGCHTDDANSSLGRTKVVNDSSFTWGGANFKLRLRTPRVRLASEMTRCIYVDQERMLVLCIPIHLYDDHVLIVDPLSVYSDWHWLVRRVTVKSIHLPIFKHTCHLGHQLSIL